MLNLKQIESYYPEKLSAFKRNILREYLQYKILEITFNSQYANNVSFLGGTALRIVYGNRRFSEDIDFDNFNLKKKDFLEISQKIEKSLKKEGYKIETKNVFKEAWRCYIRFPDILFNSGLSKLRDEKIIIQLNTAPHDFKYDPERKILNKFDVFTQIFVTPPDILLSQKIFAVLSRKRPKGRDFFDIIFLLQKAKPNYNYLKKKIGVASGRDLKKEIIKYSENLDLKEIVKDVKPFLFNPKEADKIEMFKSYIKQFNF